MRRLSQSLLPAMLVAALVGCPAPGSAPAKSTTSPKTVIGDDGGANPVEGGAAPATVELDRTAPDLKLLSVDGSSKMLSDFKGKLIVLAFYAHW